MSTGIKHSEVKFAAGAVIFKDGDPRRALFIVKSGQVAIFKLTAQNEKIPLGIVGSGEYLAETGLLEGKSNHSTWAVALTDVDAISIPSEAIEEQLKTAPQWLVALCKHMSKKLPLLNDLVRRNKLNDESLGGAMNAVEENDRKKKVA